LLEIGIDPGGCQTNPGGNVLQEPPRKRARNTGGDKIIMERAARMIFLDHNKGKP
jgi:hypothetical protein